MKVQLMSVAPYFKYLRTLTYECATALVVHWNYLYAFVQEGADLKVCDVYVAFLHVSSAFNKTVSTLQLIKEGSDVNILYFGQGTASYFAVCDNNSQCITTWCTTEHILQSYD